MRVHEGVAIGLAIAALASVLMVGLTAWFVVSRRHDIVTQHSAALAELGRLNNQYRPRLSYHPALRYEFVDRVTSKARFDRYDLRTFFLQSIGSIESEVRRHIDVRLRDDAVYAEYEIFYERLANSVGSTQTELSGSNKFLKLERKLFAKRKLPEPMCVAQVVCAVTYTSPKGQNSYAQTREWDFQELRQGIGEVNRIRESRTTTQFLRRVERNKVTPAIRAKVIDRDRSRCKMCGASVSEGVTLHVDHIIPVSKGGLSVLENLQALCQECNLGKSNRF